MYLYLIWKPRWHIRATQILTDFPYIHVKVWRNLIVVDQFKYLRLGAFQEVNTKYKYTLYTAYKYSDARDTRERRLSIFCI